MTEMTMKVRTMIKVFPKSLQEVLGEQASKDLADLLNSSQAELAASVIKVDTRFEKRLVEEISKLRADMIKWMFLFWVGQAVTVVGIMMAFMKK